MQHALTEPLSKRLLVIFLMLSVHVALWWAWQSQTQFKLWRDRPTTYLQLLPIPLLTPPQPKETQQKSPPATLAASAPVTKPAVATSHPPSHPAANATNAITVTDVPPAVTTPSPAAPANGEPSPTTHLDLDALKASALAMDKQRRPSEIEKIQHDLRRDDGFEKKLGEGIQKAKAKDCMQAYSGLGILALIPLAASAVSDKVCKW